MDSLKKNLLTIVPAIIGALIGSWAVSGLFTKDESDYSKMLMQTASKINESLPMNIDSETILVSTVGMDDFFSYKYQLTNVEANSINIEEFVKLMEPQLRNTVCTSEDLAAFRKIKIIVNYIYADHNNVHIVKIPVDTKTCEET